MLTEQVRATKPLNYTCLRAAHGENRVLIVPQEHYRQGGSGTNNAFSANLDDKTMHELYLWPFADAVKAGVGSIMCSYNQVPIRTEPFDHSL